MKILFSLILLVTIASGQEMSSELKTNRDIIDSLTVDVFSNYQFRVSDGSSDSLILNVGRLEQDKESYLRVLIGNLFSENSFRVFRNYNELSSFQGLIVEIDKFDIGVTYSKPFEKSFLGVDYVHRQIQFNLKGQVYRGRTHEVERALNKDITIKDEILYASISQADESPFGFTKGKRKDFSFWEKISEPTIVIVSVAIIVYLFFAQRS